VLLRMGEFVAQTRCADLKRLINENVVASCWLFTSFRGTINFLFFGSPFLFTVCGNTQELLMSVLRDSKILMTMLIQSWWDVPPCRCVNSYRLLQELRCPIFRILVAHEDVLDSSDPADGCSQFLRNLRNFTFRRGVMWYDNDIYLSTAIGLTPGGSSTVLIYTQTIHRTTQIQTIHRTTQITTNLAECGPCHIFTSFTPAFALQLRKKKRKTSVRVAEEW
jgi:hypothetical protein